MFLFSTSYFSSPSSLHPSIPPSLPPFPFFSLPLYLTLCLTLSLSLSYQVILTGHPIRVRKKFAVVKHMFYDPMDVRWFKPAEMVSNDVFFIDMKNYTNSFFFRYKLFFSEVWLLFFQKLIHYLSSMSNVFVFHLFHRSQNMVCVVTLKNQLVHMVY